MSYIHLNVHLYELFHIIKFKNYEAGHYRTCELMHQNTILYLDIQTC